MERARGRFFAAVALAAGLVAPEAAAAQEGRCRILCAPDVKIEPTVTFENLGDRARVEVGGVTERTERETIFELVFAVGVPTEIPRVGFTLEAIVAPFKGTSEHPFTGETAQQLDRDEIRDNLVEIEVELNIDLLDEAQTGGWLSSHFDIVDKFSPGELPGDGSAYTHKLDFELDTALHLFSRLPDGRWLRNLEAELSIDYLATGLPTAGDVIGGERYLDDASPWSVSLVLVLPLAPLDSVSVTPAFGGQLLFGVDAEMEQHSTPKRLRLAVALLAAMATAGLTLRATTATGRDPTTNPVGAFTGQALSASGAAGVGGATIHLVPVAAIDLTTPMTASAIYAPPFPAEAYDEPLEDAIRQRGSEFPQATTDSVGNFIIQNVPEGRFFIHVTPGPEDTEHLPGGDQSRRSYSAEQLRGRSMTIRVSSSASPSARAVGSSTCLECHGDKEHWQQTAHKLGWTVPGAPSPMQDFSRHPEYFREVVPVFWTGR